MCRDEQQCPPCGQGGWHTSSSSHQHIHTKLRTQDINKLLTLILILIPQVSSNSTIPPNYRALQTLIIRWIHAQQGLRKFMAGEQSESWTKNAKWHAKCDMQSEQSESWKLKEWHAKWTKKKVESMDDSFWFSTSNIVNDPRRVNAENWSVQCRAIIHRCCHQLMTPRPAWLPMVASCWLIFCSLHSAQSLCHFGPALLWFFQGCRVLHVKRRHKSANWQSIDAKSLHLPK